MESKRVSSPESAPNAVDAAPKQVDAADNSKTSKSKKTSLPAGVVLNTQLSGETDDASKEIPKSEKDGWNIEALFGKHEQDTTPDEPENAEPLTDDEARDVVQDYVDDRSEVVDAELSDTDEASPLAEIVSANQVLLDKLREQVVQSEKPVDAIIAEATDATIQELQLEPDTPNAETAPRLHDTPQQPLRTTVRQKEAVITSILAEETPEHSDVTSEPIEPPLPPTSVRATSTPEPVPELFNSSNEVDMPLSDDLAHGVHKAHSSHEAQPVATLRNTPERVEHAGPTPGDVARGVLVGGVAGYMIGRHSGRKRAEAKARPLHAEMSKEIASLQQKIAHNEQVVRSLAAQKTAHIQAEKTKPQPAYGQEKLNAQWVKSLEVATTTPTSEIPPSPSVTKRAETSTVSQAANVVASNETISTSQRDTAATEKTSRVPRTRPNQEQIRAVRPIEKLPIEDVLVIAKTVKVEGRTLDTYYRQGQLTEVDVRKILIEHRRTGRPERAFYKQINTHERQRTHKTTETLSAKRDNQHSDATSTNSSVSLVNSPSSVQNSSQVFVEAVRQAHPSPIDKIHADNTPRVGATLTVGIVVLIIFAFFLVQIVFN